MLRMPNFLMWAQSWCFRTGNLVLGHVLEQTEIVCQFAADLGRAVEEAVELLFDVFLLLAAVAARVVFPDGITHGLPFAHVLVKHEKRGDDALTRLLQADIGGLHNEEVWAGPMPIRVREAVRQVVRGFILAERKTRRFCAGFTFQK